MKKATIILTFIAVILTSGISAQNAVMNVRTRNTVSAGQTFQITFDVNAHAQDFRAPSLKGLKLVGGPNTGFSSSTSIINGKMSQSVSNTFTILVQAEKEGTANVGAASCTVDGKTVTSKPFSIKVEKADPNSNHQQQNQSGWGWGQQQQRPRQQQQQDPQPSQNIDNNTLFARASISKNSLYQGEEAIIVYKIYTQVPLTQFQIDKLPRNKGFWSEDLSENMTQVKQYTETYNGRQYQVAEIRRGALYPQENGTLNIAPLKTDVVAIIQTQMQRQRTGTIFDFFIDDPFFTPTRNQAVVKSLTSNSISVKVKPLPDAPAGFAGGVGHFDIKAKTDLDQLHAGDAFTYSVTVSGRGNLSLLEAPTIEFPKGMEVYEPRVIDNINKGDNGLSGSRTFEWIVTPQTQGEYDMPDFDYVYFDPVSGQYITKKCNKIHIKVDKPLHNSSAKSDVKILNSDIHHISKQTKLNNINNHKAPVLFWILTILPALAAALIVIFARRQQDIVSDEASMRLQRATKLARKRLRNAERHLNDGDDERFYEEIYKALWGGIADKFTIQQSLLSSDTIRQHLSDKHVDETLQQDILATLADVDFARFAPGDSSTKKQNIYNKAMNTITQIAAIKTKVER
ncbi:MAG: protein BatD [Bacteroidales bacterium]|nr:protein BatD [Bacteroidales bacterium]